MTRASYLAERVQAARIRAFHWCAAHNRASTPECGDCVVESVFGIRLKSLKEIMR
jgi:hypothetical protein